MSEKEKYIEELRALADFYERAPDDLPRPYISTQQYVEKKDLPTILKHCKSLEKSVYGGSVKLTKTLIFGSVSFLIAQQEVCERKVIGQTWVPEYKTDGHFVDQVEWECKPILKSLERKEGE